MGPLTNQAQDFVDHGGNPRVLSELLRECIDAGTVDGLLAVQLLAEDMYGGFTFNSELKAPAAHCLVRWGDTGLRALVEAAHRTPTFKNQAIALEVLASTAAGQRIPGPTSRGSPELASRVGELVDDWDATRQAAGSILREYVLSFEDEDELVLALGNVLMRAAFNPFVTEPLFQAMAGRWSAVTGIALDEFARLLAESPRDEPRFQQFLERHPLIIDPMAAEVFPRPNIHGAREPDFLLRRTDDTFLVVEIETPSKSLVTSGNQLAAEATHAAAQAVDYADFLTERSASIREHLPSFRRPECLVVIGLEQTLNEAQARALRLENDARRGVRIVGFDWLLARTMSVRDNVIAGRIAVSSRLRVV